MEKYKRCTICKKEILLSLFSKRRKSKDGLACSCKQCVKKYKKQYYLCNKSIIRKWIKENHNKVLLYRRTWYKKYKNTSIKKYREENKEKIANYRHNYGPSYERKRRKYDIKFKLRMNVGCLIRSRLKQRLANKGKKSISSYLPYSIDELKIHLENKFQPGMNWKNYGKWHIDHKIPDSFFNYSSTKDLSFKKCWALNNLQPMWAKDNLQKGKKLHT